MLLVIYYAFLFKVYGVFAKKPIPKRTQFGPVEGVLVKHEDPPSDHFILVVNI